MRAILIAGLIFGLASSADAQTSTTPPVAAPGMPSVSPVMPSLRSRLRNAVPSNQPGSTTAMSPGPVTPAATSPLAPAPATAAPMAIAPMATAPATTADAAPRTGRHRTQQDKFDAANVTHDGHLTLAQAQAAPPMGWPMVVRNYDKIDVAHKGFVTMDDIHAYNRSKRAARRAAH